MNLSSVMDRLSSSGSAAPVGQHDQHGLDLRQCPLSSDARGSPTLSCRVSPQQHASPSNAPHVGQALKPRQPAGWRGWPWHSGGLAGHPPPSRLPKRRRSMRSCVVFPSTGLLQCLHETVDCGARHNDHPNCFDMAVCGLSGHGITPHSCIPHIHTPARCSRHNVSCWGCHSRWNAA